MGLEEWHPSEGDKLDGRYGREGLNEFVETDDGSQWILPHAAEVKLRMIDPDIGWRITVVYNGQDLRGDEFFNVTGHP